MNTLFRALKYSGVIGMLLSASCGVGAAPGVSAASPAAGSVSAPAVNSAPAANSAQPQANTTRNPSSSMNRAPANRSSSTIPQPAPSPAPDTTDTLQQQRQQSGEQMIQERKGRAADSN
ncbi:hypothetical protein [Pseudomonas rhizosphaerae]|uniref:hypothetical protein n=1 Tax=Pseudomonas rhizosphaerae TaxID=216142 RepID=UPI0017867CAD|nr:hypothetical protein [Pseudomonas rhizosphaerae]MBD8613672.1 hypothetical protein [Pseudomonas putida]MEB2871038.1 hypothetical protein [Pseudomonas rhizosphaerae]